MLSTKTLLIILFLLVVFSVSYLKNTYVINLFSDDYDILIRRFYSAEIYQLDRPLLNNDMSSNPRVISVLFFHLLFAGINSGFIYLIFRKLAFQKAHLVAFGSLSVLVFIAYAAYIPTRTTAFYEGALIIKDFLQSAVYSFIFVIVALNYRQFISEK